MRRGVIVDKNFLQGASQAQVHELASSHQLIMTAALFHELLTTSPEARRKCFGKLPATLNPVVLVDHIGVLLAHESVKGRPAGKPSGHRIEIRYRFNELLLDETYQLPKEAAEAVAEQEVDVQSDIERLIVLSEQTASLFPGLLSGTTAEQNAALGRAQRAIGQLEQIHRFYSNLEASAGAPPHPRICDRYAKWAHLRWLQVLMLFAVNLFVRYRGNLRQHLTPKVLERLEHDVHDAQILALGVLEGAIATREQKLLKWWRLLAPGRKAHGATA